MSKANLIGSLILSTVELPNDRIVVLTKLAELLGGNDGPAWSALLKRTRVAGLPAQPPAPKSSSLLKLVSDSVQLDAVAAHNPQEFFKTRKDLWVSDEFKSRVLSKAKPVENLDPVTLSSHELTKNTYDRDITPGLGENYIFDESEVCARIEQLVSKQPNGEAGDLLNNGYANLFYVAGYVVDVRWYGDGREWSVRAWELDDDYWSAGSRVFSRN